MQLTPRAEGRLSSNRPLRLLYFGRLIADKGVHTAVEAMAHLASVGLGDKVTLSIVGHGHPDYEAELLRQIRERGLTERVTFAGQVLRREIPAWLRWHDVCLFTSIWPEPMARSVMEAMAAGLLVIGSRTGGQVEMLQEGINALTFAPGDSPALATQIRKALMEPELRKRLAEQGRRTVAQRFSLTRMVDEMETFLEEIAVSDSPRTQVRTCAVR